MLGRTPKQDMSTGAPGRPGYDPITKFGAGVLYDDDVAAQYTNTVNERKPRWVTLNASNKDSERFIGNMPVRIVVAQLAGQTQPRNLKTLVSRPLVLRPGNQSLGGR